MPEWDRYDPCLLEGYLEWTLPSWPSEQYDLLGLDEKNERHLYLELLDRVFSYGGEEEIAHRFMGYPDQIQTSLGAECEMGSTGANWESPGLKERALQWVLLMQIDSEKAAGMRWGGAGRLYFCMREEDLKRLEFDKAWMTMQSY